jgi:hypothetical protein
MLSLTLCPEANAPARSPGDASAYIKAALRMMKSDPEGQPPSPRVHLTSPSSDRASRAADFYSAAVYGSVVAAAMVGAFREEHVSSEDTALALLSTMGVFWLAHLWSGVVGERIHLGKEFSVRSVGHIARSEWPLVEAAFLPTAILALGWRGALGHDTASTLALAVCELQLVAWGFLAGRRAFSRWWAAALAGAADGALGIALVSLEIAVLHHR